MKSVNGKTAQSTVTDQVFDCGKMKSLIEEKEKMSFNQRFRNWIAAYTKEANEKIWRDIEYFQAK